METFDRQPKTICTFKNVPNLQYPVYYISIIPSHLSILLVKYSEINEKLELDTPNYVYIHTFGR